MTEIGYVEDGSVFNGGDAGLESSWSPYKAASPSTPTAPVTDRKLGNGLNYSEGQQAFDALTQAKEATAAQLFASQSATAGTLAASAAKSQMDREIAQMEQSGAMSRTQATIAGQWAITQATVAGQMAMGWLDNEIKRLTANATNRLAVLTLLKDLRGPRNAFQQQAVIHGLNAAGLSRAVDSLMGGATPSFQAPQANPEPVTLDTFLADTGAMLPGEIQQMPMPQVPGVPPAMFGGAPGAFSPGAPPPALAPAQPSGGGYNPNTFSWENGKTFSGADPAFVQRVLSDLDPRVQQALADYAQTRPDFRVDQGIKTVMDKYGPAAASMYALSWTKPDDQIAYIDKQNIMKAVA